MANIYSISLGCPKNRVDTERLLAAIPGYALVESMAEAHCVLINTCGFIAPAVEESVRVIVEAVADREESSPGQRPLLVVAGCLVGRYGAATLAPDLPEVDLWLDNADLAAWPELLLAALRQGHEKNPGFFPAVTGGDSPRLLGPGRALSTGPSYAWLKISDGCDHACSFCTIPAIRGAFHSSSAEALTQEARLLLGAGVRELVLVAQDTTAWGRDLGAPGREYALQNLLEQLLPLPGLDRLRIMYMYPAGLSHDLLRFLQGAGAPFVPYFDIPVQHSHSDILAAMGRPFARDPRISLDRVREYFPQAALRTSIIVGFPGETDAHFQHLCDFVRETRFQHLGVFAYQAEEGTGAATMPGQLPVAVKEWRREALMALQAEVSEELLAGYLGARLPILVDAAHPEWPGLHVGRAWFQAPESDGVTYISGPGVTPGAVVEAEITETQVYDLVALA